MNRQCTTSNDPFQWRGNGSRMFLCSNLMLGGSDRAGSGSASTAIRPLIVETSTTTSPDGTRILLYRRMRRLTHLSVQSSEPRIIHHAPATSVPSPTAQLPGPHVRRSERRAKRPAAAISGIGECRCGEKLTGAESGVIKCAYKGCESRWVSYLE